MKGIEEAKKFYLDYGKDMIHSLFPEYEGRIAVGLVGHGSECFGFDDDISKDHDYTIGFCMWLTKEDEEKIGFKLTRAYDKLVKEHLNNKTHKSTLGETPQGVYIIEDFYRKYTGRLGGPETLEDWLYTESTYFAEATNGEVFRDDLGIFTSIREQIKKGMPEDVRLKKLAAECVKAAQTGQYNFARCISHGEIGSAILALTEFVKSASNIIFLLNNEHCPYYKWIFKSLRNLEILGDLVDSLEYLLTSENDTNGLNLKKEMIEGICHSIALELRKQYEIGADGDYLEPYGFALYKKIKNANLRNLHIMID